MFAIYGGVGWLVTLWHQSPGLAVLMALAFGFSPFAAAALTGPALRGGGIAAWVALSVFMLMDAAGNANAFFEFEKVATMDQNHTATVAHTTALGVYTADLAAAKAAHGSATAKLLTLPTASAVCEGVGPITCDGKRNAIAGDREALTTQALTAKLAVDALVAPTAPAVVRLLPPEVSATLHCLLSFALVGGFLGLHRAEKRMAQPAAKPKRARKGGRKGPTPRPPVAPVKVPLDVVTAAERRALMHVVN